MLGGSMDVANRALQRASFEDGRGAGVGGDRIDNPDRGFGRVSASGTKEGPRLQKTIASDIGRHHELCHGVNQICARLAALFLLAPPCPEPAHRHASAW